MSMTLLDTDVDEVLAGLGSFELEWQLCATGEEEPYAVVPASLDDGVPEEIVFETVRRPGQVNEVRLSGEVEWQMTRTHEVRPGDRVIVKAPGR